ncbi:MAG: hypothetical protein KatS3mg094_049 [Candidatus Parcubacteria bacterium]|nr:MAG: hypothetical protein KatS3mg094_049 [Candidatus Parcubacteria bacterium]
MENQNVCQVCQQITESLCQICKGCQNCCQCNANEETSYDQEENI